MLTFVLATKLIAEIALLALFGQWLLGLVLGASPQRNPFYGVLQLLSRPWISALRWIAPQRVADRYLPMLAFLLLLLAWLAASVVKVKICLQIGVALCK
ncbi:MAG: hypothetical protein ABIV07_14040 [Polaromonas sp.]